MSGLLQAAQGPMALEAGLFALLVVVFVVGLVQSGRSSRVAGWLTFAGLVALSAFAFKVEAGSSALGGTFVVDHLAVLAKRLFLVSAALSVLASLGLRATAMSRRSMEYHVALLASLYTTARMRDDRLAQAIRFRSMHRGYRHLRESFARPPGSCRAGGRS